MKATDLITYETAADMLRKSKLPCTTRTLHTYATETYRRICPAIKQSYHHRRVSRAKVKKLITHLLAQGKGRDKSPRTIRLHRQPATP